MKTLIYCLDILKIKEGTEVYRKAVKLTEKVPIEPNSGWISVMKGNIYVLCTAKDKF